MDVQFNADEIANKLAEATKRVTELKDEQKKLRDEMQKGGEGAAEAAKKYAANTAEIEANTRVVKSSTAALALDTQNRLSSNASLDEQRQLLNAAQKAYASLSGEERRAADVKGGLRDQINALSESVKKQEEAIGDSRRNVGGYAAAIEQAAKNGGVFGGAMNRLIAPVKGVTMGLKTMSATPAIAILGLLAQIMVTLGDRFKSSGAAMERLTSVFGAFNGIGVIVQKLVDKISDGVGWLAEKLYKLADRFGLISEEMKESQRIAEEDYAIYQRRTELIQEEADAQQRVAELRNKIAQKDKYTNEERLRFLKEAIDTEKRIAKEREDIARREYEQIKAKNAQSDSSKEDLRKEAEAYAALQRAQTDYLNATIKLQGQAVAFAQEIKKEEIERAENLRELNAQIERFLKDSTEYSVSLQASVDKMQEAREELANLVEEEDEAFIEPLSEYQQAIADCMKQGDDFETAQIRAAAIIAGKWSDAAATMAGGFASAFGAVSDLLAEYGEENEAAMAASKAFAMAGVLASEAETIANGIKGVSAAVASGAGVPFPANLAAIATGVAAVTSTIAGVVAGITQAKQILSQDAGKFASGGVVGGNSYSGDRLIAHVNSGEGIYTPTQANTILQQIANNPLRGGVDYSAMADALGAAMAAQPAPTVVYTELEQFGQKVTTYKEIASI